MATLRQKKAFKEVTENHRPVSTAMIGVGYSPQTASKPSNLTKSKGWEELMEKHLPDKLLAKVHKEGLGAAEQIIIEGQVIGSKPDYAVRHKYLDSAYKLKKRYETSEGGGNKTLIVVVAGETSQRYAIPSITKDSSPRSS